MISRVLSVPHSQLFAVLLLSVAVHCAAQQACVKVQHPHEGINCTARERSKPGGQCGQWAVADRVLPPSTPVLQGCCTAHAFDVLHVQHRQPHMPVCCLLAENQPCLSMGCPAGAGERPELPPRHGGTESRCSAQTARGCSPAPCKMCSVVGCSGLHKLDLIPTFHQNATLQVPIRGPPTHTTSGRR